MRSLLKRVLMDSVFFMSAIIVLTNAASYGKTIKWEDYVDKPQVKKFDSSGYIWKGVDKNAPPQEALVRSKVADEYRRCKDFYKGIYGYVDGNYQFVPVGPMCPDGKKCTCLIGGPATEK